MFENDLEVLLWAGALHGGFLILLFMCLLLHCCSWWPRNHHKSVQLAVPVKSRIRAVVESRIEDLRAAVKKVIMARLEDGSLEFSDETERAESDLFLLVRGLLNELREGVPQEGDGLPQDQLTFLQRCLKKELQASPYELRGSRRAAVLCDFIKMALKNSSIYSPGFMSKRKRSCCFPKTLLKLLGLRYETKVFAAILLPVVLVAVDLSSDGGMLLTMWNYNQATSPAPDNSTGPTTTWDTTITMAHDVTVTEPTSTTTQDNTTGNTTAGGRVVGRSQQVANLTNISGFILLLATVSLLWSNPLPSLLCKAHTAVAMGSREEEEKDVSLPLDTVTRHDMAMAESTGEAAWQFVIQWLFYLTSVATAVRSQMDVFKKEELSLNFSLVFSTAMSLISLTMAQYKAQMLTREFSSSFFQKAVCFLSSLCSVASSQVLLTQAVYAISESGGSFGLSAALVAPLFIIWMHILAVFLSVRGSPLTVIQRADYTDGFIPHMKAMYSLMFSKAYSTMMELLQLQSSRATMTTWKGKIFSQPQHRGFLFRENLVAHIVLEMVSLTCLGLSLGLPDHFPESVGGVFSKAVEGEELLLSPVYSKSPALQNFLLTAAILGPAGWVMAQGLDWFNNWLDSGSQTCGLDYIYEEKEDEENEEEENEEEENSVEENIEEEDAKEDRNRTMREDILSVLFKKDVTFLSVTGRWSHPEEQEEKEEHNIGVAQELEEMV